MSLQFLSTRFANMHLQQFGQQLDDNLNLDYFGNTHLLKSVQNQLQQVEPCGDSKSYLTNLCHNNLAEFKQHLMDSEPKMMRAHANECEITIIDDDYDHKLIRLTDLWGVNEEDVPKDKRDDVSTFSKHFFVYKNMVYISQKGQGHLELVQFGEFTFRLENSKFQRIENDMEARYPPKDTTTLFDFGYIGDSLAKHNACVELLRLLKNPDDDVTASKKLLLLKCLANPKERVETTYAPMPDVIGGEKVPINTTQYNVLKGLRYNIEAIQGPPGTGKSTTIFHLVSSRLPEDEVALVTCVQNKAVEAVVEKLAGNVVFYVTGNPTRLPALSLKWTLESQAKRTEEYLEGEERVYDLARQLTFYEKKISALELGIKNNDVRDRRRETRLKSIYTHKSPDYIKELVDKDRWGLLWRLHCQQKYSFLYEDCRSCFHELQEARQKLNLILLTQMDRIQMSSRAILCTIASTASIVLPDQLRSKVTTVIIDEAGTAPETCVPVVLVWGGLRRVVAVGDQKQLQPFSRTQSRGICYDYLRKQCTRIGCKFSHDTHGVFHRLEWALRGEIATLTTQYRMHPRISAVVSELFYDNKLKDNDSIKQKRSLENPHGIYKIEHYGKESKEPHSTSFKNDTECSVAVQLYKKLHQQHPRKSIMLITYYKAQERLLKRTFEEERIDCNCDEFRLCSVDQSQGNEADYVILSTVRTGTLGFVKNPNRLNVAISRARDRLYIIGDSYTLNGDMNWRTIWSQAHAKTI
eukprot:m.338028 g.338028  ORF g.338028 m.338028 type:complete len:751 (-) comp18294_c0_seq1:152-2404(-)